MKVYGAVAVELHSFLNLALDGVSCRHYDQILHPWEISMLPSEWEIGWAPETLCMIWRRD